jgi:outer membrane protein assembly factor BamB
MPAALTIHDLIFVGRGGWALAVHRETGQIVWSNDQMKSGYTTLLLDGDRLIVSTNGYLYCLDPLSGRILWQNPLTGYRVGVTTLASVRGGSPADGAAAEMAADTDERQQAATT